MEGGEVDGVGFAAGLKSHKVSGWAGYSGGTLWQLTGRWRIARSSFWSTSSSSSYERSAEANTTYERSAEAVSSKYVSTKAVSAPGVFGALSMRPNSRPW